LSLKLRRKGNLGFGVLKYCVLAIDHQQLSRAISNKFLQNYKVIVWPVNKSSIRPKENIVVESPEPLRVYDIHCVCLEIYEIIDWLVSQLLLDLFDSHTIIDSSLVAQQYILSIAINIYKIKHETLRIVDSFHGPPNTIGSVSACCASSSCKTV